MPMCMIAPFQVLTSSGYRLFKMFDAIKNGFLLCIHNDLVIRQLILAFHCTRAVSSLTDLKRAARAAPWDGSRANHRLRDRQRVSDPDHPSPLGTKRMTSLQPRRFAVSILSTQYSSADRRASWRSPCKATDRRAVTKNGPVSLG